MHRAQIDVVITSIFYKQVAGLTITWEDVKDTDPVLYGSWKKILEKDVDVLRGELGIERPPDMREIRRMIREQKKREKQKLEQQQAV